MSKTTEVNPIEGAVERILQQWERADLDPQGAAVRRGMALEIRLAMRKASA